MQVWTVTEQTEASMDSYWIVRCWYGQLLGRQILVWSGTRQTDDGMAVTGQTYTDMISYCKD